MSIGSDVYYTHKDGAYVAADEGDFLPFSWFEVVSKVLLQVVLNIPSFVKDFIHAYIWAPKKSISGCVALVSGGGNGFGRALCLSLAQEGCKVAVADIDEKGAIRTASEIRKLGMQAVAFYVDVSDLKSVRQLRKEVELKLGYVDILVNNAGLLVDAKISDGSDEAVRRIIDVNLTSHYWMIREFKPAMIERNSGHIVGISSILGFYGTFRTNSYCATKFGVRGMMESLNEELYFNGQDEKVFATCVYPSLIATRKDLMKTAKDMGVLMETMYPEQAASIVVKGILQNKREIILGSFLVRLVIKLYVFLPIRLRHITTSCIIGDASRCSRLTNGVE
ncbi:uncharacterized oxidoreductase YoxD-like [Ochlerotatus camptorhynchus]|uniref:uncharacterized oxidoreductase YoxD-like n=1 Tax=Ochlerotatus camptorhynchus TaxID=644619 RepID=UPI0031DA93DA